MPDSKCSAKIIDLKDRIHEYWFDSQTRQVRTPEISYVEKESLDHLLNKGKEALTQAKECGADPSLIGQLDRLIARVGMKLAGTKEIRREGEIYYALPKEVAQNLFVSDINKLANTVHKIGRSLFEVAGKYGGCKLGPDEDTSELNAGVLSYCEGAPGENAMIMKGGTRVEHHLGCHSAKVDIQEAERGYDLKLDYTESGYENYRERLSKAIDVLQDKYNLECTGNRLHAECQGKIRDLGRIRELATFLGRLVDIDLLKEECVESAVGNAYETAREVNEELRERAYTSYEGVRDIESWKSYLDCYPEEERREREEEEEERPSRGRILLRQLQSTTNDIRYFQGNARMSKCTPHAYSNLFYAIKNEQNIDNICMELSRIGEHWREKSCEMRLNEVKEVNTRLANELVARCPPEPIILSAEATPGELQWTTNNIQAVCERIENEECLTAIKQALLREEKGWRPTTLELGPKGVF